MLHDLLFLLFGENKLDNRLLKDGLETVALIEDVSDCVLEVVVGVVQGEPVEDILELQIFITRLSFFLTLRGYFMLH